METLLKNFEDKKTFKKLKKRLKQMSNAQFTDQLYFFFGKKLGKYEELYKLYLSECEKRCMDFFAELRNYEAFF